MRVLLVLLIGIILVALGGFIIAWTPLGFPGMFVLGVGLFFIYGFFKALSNKD
jgi:hypothetical protein